MKKHIQNQLRSNRLVVFNKLNLKTIIFVLIMGISTITSYSQITQLHNWPLFRPNTTSQGVWMGTTTVNSNSYLPTPSNSLSSYLSMNAQYSETEDLLFYVISKDVNTTYIYDASGTLRATLGSGGEEIGIMPVPNQCGIYHIIVGGTIYVWDLPNLNVTNTISMVPANITGPPVVDYTWVGGVALSHYDNSTNSYRVYTIMGSYSDVPSIPFNGDIYTRTYLYEITVNTTNNTIGSNQLYMITESDWQYSGIVQRWASYEYFEECSEMELSADGNYVAFSNGRGVFVYNLSNSSLANSYVNSTSITPKTLVCGIEFKSDNKLCVCYNQPYTTNGTDYVMYWDWANNASPTYISGSTAYSASQIEMGRDGKIYLRSSGGLGYINFGSNSISSGLSVSNSNYSNSFISSITNLNIQHAGVLCLPDQIDGYMTYQSNGGGTGGATASIASSTCNTYNLNSNASNRKWYTDATDYQTCFGIGQYATITITANTTVYMSVVDAATGCESSSRVSLALTYNTATADFSNASTACQSSSISFTDASSVSSGSVSSWAWDFGDGSTSTLQNPTHTYTSSGIKSCSLTVTTSTGCTNMKIRSIIINGLPTTPATPTSAGGVAAMCQNTNLNISTSTNGLPTYKWYDGATLLATGGTTYTYHSSSPVFSDQTHNFTVTVTDANLCVSAPSAALTITVVGVNVNAAAQSYNKCTPYSITLNSPSAGGHTYMWYQTPSTYKWTGAGYSTTTAGTYYYTASHTVSGVTCNATSGNITVNNYATPTVSITGTPLINLGATTTLTATITSNNSIYNSYQWFLNGNQIVGATSSTYSATAPGSYTVQVSGNCNSITSPPVTVTYACNPAGYDNTTFPTTTGLGGNVLSTTTYTGGTYIVAGDLIIPAGVSVTFTNCKLIMAACSQIDVQSGSSSAGGTLIANGSSFYSCAKWAGIRRGSGGYAGQITIKDNSGTPSYIANAEAAILSNGPLNSSTTIAVDHTIFEDNNYHIVIIDDNTVPTINSCTFNPLSNTNLGSCSTTVPTLKNSSVRKMVYADNSPFTMNAAIFTGQSNLSSNLFGIELHNCGGTTINGVSTFSNHFTTAIHSYLTTNLDINSGGNSSSQITFKGSIDTAISNTNGSGLKVYWCWFGQSGNTAQQVVNGIYCKESDGSYFRHNKFRYCDLGLQYYHSNGSTSTTAKENHFYHCHLGLVIAPDKDPEPAAGGSNTGSNSINLTIQCNKFDYNDAGIFGCGNLITQGSTGTNSGNEFTGNTIFGGVWNSSIYFYAPNTDINQGSNAGLYINGTLVTAVGFNPQIVNNSPACYQFSVQAPVFTNQENTEIQENIVNVYPNPFSKEFIVDIKGIDWEHNIITYELYDVAGRKLENRQLLSEQTLLQNNNYTSGIYILRIKQNGTKLKELKLVKTAY